MLKEGTTADSWDGFDRRASFDSTYLGPERRRAEALTLAQGPLGALSTQHQVVIDFIPATEATPDVGADDFPLFELEPLVDARQARIRVYHGSHERNAAANGFEVATMVKLGDDEEFSHREFIPHFDHSFVIELTEEIEGQESITGMMRIIPHSAEKGTKTFHDIATLTGKSYEDIEQEFTRESGCDDMAKVWDIASLAVDLDASKIEIIQAITNMLAALNQVGFQQIRAGKLTHVVSENDPKMHGALLAMGYPIRDLNGYGNMYYDLGKTGRAMTCHPAYFTIPDLEASIRAGRTPHMRKLQPILAAFE